MLAGRKMAGMDAVENVLNGLKPSGGKAWWEMGLKENRGELGIRLEASGIENVWITDASSERCMDAVRGVFDESRDDTGNGIFHVCIRKSEDADDDFEFLRRLLALGLNPDLPCNSAWRPSHECGEKPRPLCAEVLSVCRPDLAARSAGGRTPAEVAHDICVSKKEFVSRIPFQKTRELWENFERNGFPSVAQLACERKYWAVKNLCRRRKVDLAEIRWQYRGRDAVEWSEFNGNPRLAEEIRYLFKYPTSEPERTAVQKPQETTRDDTEVLHEMVAACGASVAALEGQFKDLSLQMDAREGGLLSKAQSVEKEIQLVKREIEHVRALLVCVQEKKSEVPDTAPGLRVPTGSDPVLEAVDVMLGGIRRMAMAGQKTNVLTELGVLTERLKLELASVAPSFG